MKYFSVPADFKTETIDAYDGLHKSYPDSKVLETYGQITVENRVESGRAKNLLPKVGLAQLEEYVRHSAKKNIGFNYTLNASHMGNKEFTEEGVYQIKRFLSELYEVGVRALTITLPTMIEIVKSMKYDFDIKLSTICQVTNVNKAKWYRQMGVGRIVVGESINRKFEELKRIRNACGPKIEVIANSICHINCVNRMFHYNQISHDSVNICSESSLNYYQDRCMMKRYETLGNVLKLSWIRPEDIKHYTAIGIEYFKLQGRQLVLKGDPVRTVEHYFKEDFDGNLFELLEMFSSTNPFRIYVDNKKLNGFLDPLLQDDDFCKDDCDSCGYCESIAMRCADSEKTKEIMHEAQNYYKEYDNFNKLIHTVNYEKADEMDEEKLKIEFDF